MSGALPRFVLASSSPARLSVLRAAGLDPQVLVSGVDEDAVLAATAGAPAADRLVALARAKADAVLGQVAGPAVLLGCDSMLLVDGELVGKPGTADAARARWRRLTGRSGELLTGHAVMRLDAAGQVTARAAATRRTGVVFGEVPPEQIDAYVATGEPLAVAGAFTLDGLGGWFVERIDGDPSNVIGVSLPLVRALLAEVGVAVTDLWHPRPGRDCPA